MLECRRQIACIILIRGELFGKKAVKQTCSGVGVGIDERHEVFMIFILRNGGGGIAQ